MEKKTDLDLAGWVDRHMSALRPPDHRAPDVNRALARLRERRQLEAGRLRRRNWVFAAATTMCLSVVAFPAPRSAAQRFCETCQGYFLKKVDTASRLQPEAARKAPPDFTLKDARGTTISLSSFKGKVVLLDFWATWCGGCKVEIPWFAEFANKYGSNGLAVVGVSMDDGGWSVVKPFVEQKRIGYPIVIGNEGLAKKYGVEAMPMTFLIDRNGKIAASHIGLVDKAIFEQQIQELLKERPSSRA